MAGAGFLGGIYARIEGAFFSLMDALQDKGLPVYSLIEPLEKRGVPVFPVSAALLVALLFFAYGFFFAMPSSITLELDLRDSKGVELSDVMIVVKDASGRELASGVKGFGEEMLLKGVGIGAKITVEASKKGYADAMDALPVSGERVSATIRMRSDADVIVGQIRLIDAETGDAVRDAKVVASFAGGRTENCSAEGGITACPDVLEGEDVMLSITSSNYEDKEYATKFSEGSVNEVPLSPKAGAKEGKTSLIVRAYDEGTSELLDGVSLKIYNADSEALISEVVFDREYTEKITKGISVRIVAEKNGYAMYDSGAAGEKRTMREDEVLWEARLKKGGTTLRAAVTDALKGLPLSGAEVMLFNLNAEFIAKDTTKFAGEVEFGNIDAENKYYVTAYKDRYLPARVELTPKEQASVNIGLEKITATNSASLEITVEDSLGNIGNSAKLDFFEVVGEETLPLGIPQQNTDFFGKYTTSAVAGKTIKVNAGKGIEQGSSSAKIEGGKANEIQILMEKAQGAVLLRVVDEKGLEISGGRLRVTAGSGTVLFDGNYAMGGVQVAAGSNLYLKVSYTSAEGKAFAEEVSIEGKDEVEVRIGGKNAAGFSPVIAFEGVTTISGREVEGVTKGEDYFLKFRVSLPEGECRGGMHIRIGEDSVKYADSEDAGIIGFSAAGAKHQYGRTYSPMPEPGFEGIDYENKGMEGAYNKWLELYFSSGGEKAISVRVRAKETATADSFDVHYRAWAEMAGAYYRSPEDTMLGKERYTRQRGSLYAETKTESVRIFESLPECRNELCASYRFIGGDGSEYPAGEFRAAQNGLYALEVELNPREEISATVKASTSKTEPRIAFTGYAINSLGEFPDSNKNETSIEAKDVQAGKGSAAKVRLYFKAKELGNAYITLQVITEKGAITETFHFETYVERSLIVSTVPEFAVLGEDFSILVKDEEFRAVENAQIRIMNPAGELLRTITGDGSRGAGLDGLYNVENSFDAGVLKIEVSAEGAKPTTIGVEIGKGGIIELPASIGILITKGQKTGTTKVSVKNKSGETVQNIEFEVRAKSMPAGMTLSIQPIPYISGGSSGYATLTAEYAGDEERAHGEAEVSARGTMLGKYRVAAKTNVAVDYNPELAESCLEFSKETVAIYLASGYDEKGYLDSMYSSGSYGSGQSAANQAQSSYYRYNSYSTTTEEKISITNKCNMPLTLTTEVVPGAGSDDYIDVGVDEEVVLQPAGTETNGKKQDTKEITIFATNTVLRNFPEKQRYDYDIFFRSDAITKSVPLEVYIWNPIYALQMNRNIELWLAEGSSGETATASAPLFIMNSGHGNIENITFSVSTAKSRGSVSVQVEPPYPIPALRVGETLSPARFVTAQARRTEKATLTDLSELVVRGTVNGTSFDFGPVYINAHVSPASCISVNPSSISFRSAEAGEGALQREITIFNKCADEVSIRGIEGGQFLGNELTLANPSLMIAVGASVKAKLILTKREAYSSGPRAVFLKGFLVRTQRWVDSNPVTVDVQLGRTAREASTATITRMVSECREGEMGGAVAVRFPKIASTANCDLEYCDAKLLAEFLVKRIEEKFLTARRLVMGYKGDVFESSCGTEAQQGYCSFENLGVESKTFEVFMMNDVLSTEMLMDALKKSNVAELRGYFADYLSAGTSAGSVMGGYAKHIFLTDAFRGCGRYMVNISGAVKLQGSRLLEDYISIVIELHPEGEGGAAREETEQCLPEIQNAMNFLPVDSGLAEQGGMDSWQGMVSAEDEKLRELGEDFAKKLFGDEKRFASASSSNKVVLRSGVEEGYLVKLSMVKVGDAEPRTVYANIKEVAGEKWKDISKEAADAVKDLRSASTDDMCISPDREYFLIKSAREIDELKINVECRGGKINLQYGKPSCCEFSVAGTASDKATVSAHISGDRTGMKEPWIEERGTGEGGGWSAVKGSVALKREEGKVGEAGNEKGTGAAGKAAGNDASRLQPGTGAGDGTGAREGATGNEGYSAKLRVCTEGLNDFQNAIGKEVMLGAESLSHVHKRAEPKTVKLDACGIHPQEMLSKLAKAVAEKKAGKYYATIVWNNPPNEIAIGQMSSALDVGKIIEKARENREKSEPIASRLSGIGEYLPENAKLNAILTGYLPACAITAAVLGTIKGGLAGMFVQPLVVCGIPAGWAALGETEYGKGLQKIVYGYAEKLAKYLPESTKKYTAKLGEFLKGDLGSEVDNLKAGATAMVAGRAIYGGMKWESIKLLVSPWRLVKGIAGNLLTSIVPNAVGLWFYDWRYEKITQEKGILPEVKGTEETMVDSDGDGKPDRAVVEESSGMVLHKYATYEITVRDVGYGIKHSIQPLNALPADAKTENIWCDAESTSRTLEDALGGILPQPDDPPEDIGWKEHQDHVLAYFAGDGEKGYASIIRTAASRHGIPDALLVAVAIWKTNMGTGGNSGDYITGCNYRDAAYKAPEAGFECAAEKLGRLLAPYRQPYSKEHIIAALKAYNIDKGNKETPAPEGEREQEYWEKWYLVYEKWNSYSKIGAKS